MEQIKFRGQNLNSDEWEYGFYLADDKGHYICDFEGIEAQVKPETVGQYTGLNDKNGKEIYEGDKIEFDAKEWGDNRSNIHVVEWDEEDGRWSWGGGLTSDMEFRTVVGNIHETK